MNSILALSLEQLSNLLKAGTVSAKQVCEACLKRAEETKQLNAFITLCNNSSLEKADCSDNRLNSGKRRGALEGIPVAVKDNFCSKGVKTTCASAMLADFVPPYNATVIDRLHDAGAYYLGKTNLDEFAMGSGTSDSIFGPTLNIFGSGIDGNDGVDGPRVAGGSSGGSAIAVASGSVYAAIGSDTGGSTRNPASYCGIVGFKPTYGHISRYGLIPLVNSMDVPGILTRTVTDAALVYDSLKGYDEKDGTSSMETETNRVFSGRVKDLTIGIPIEFHCYGLHREVADSWDQVASLFKEAGAKVKQISLKHIAMSLPVYTVLNQCEVASNMARYDSIRYGFRSGDGETSSSNMMATNRSRAFNQAVRSRILAGNYFLLARNYNKFFKKAAQVRRLIADEFNEAWNQGIDVMVTPVTPSPAPKLSDWLTKSNRERSVESDYCSQPSNLVGCPAVSVPVGMSSENVPLAIQLMSVNGSDSFLLQVAAWLESQVKFKPYLALPHIQFT